MQEARTKVKDIDSVEYAFTDIDCSLGLCLKNGRFRFLSSLEELNMALLKCFAFLRCTPVREKCPVSELFWSEYGKMWTRVTLTTDTFWRIMENTSLCLLP